MNRVFDERKKGIDKSRRPLQEVICRKYYCNKEGVKKLGDKVKKGLPSTIVLILEFSVLLNCIFVCVYYQMKVLGGHQIC